VDRDTVLWTLVVFFGASIMFGAIRNATEDESAGVQLLAQLGAALLVVGAIVVIVRRRRQ
jgi:MYXO-CTERM domain-containing protein